MRKEVSIIGSGVGGLAAAIRLRLEGFPVTVYEKNERPGGKLASRVTAGGYVDLGPTLLTMIPVFEDLYAAAGTDFHDNVDLVPVDPTCRYHWSDGTRFDAHGCRQDLLDETARVFPDDAEALDRFLNDVARLYDATADIFLTRPFRGLRELFTLENMKLLPLLGQLGFTSTMQRVLESRFQDPRLVQLLGRFSTYNGSSPYTAPATLNVIAHVELTMGSWYPVGGMESLARSMAGLAESLGVRIETGSEVTGVVKAEDRKSIASIVVNGSETVSVDILVSNVDALRSWCHLLEPAGMEPPSRVLDAPRSCSGYLVTAAVQKGEMHRAHHGIWFSDDYSREFEQIFNQGTYPDDMTIYRSVPAVSDPSLSPDELESWYLLVNVPSHADRVDRDEYNARIFERLRSFGIHADPLDVSVMGPEEIESWYGSAGGAIYGASSNSVFSAFLRHGNSVPGIDNLYFVGGSVHPGGGLPLVTLSGKIVAELITGRWGRG